MLTRTGRDADSNISSGSVGNNDCMGYYFSHLLGDGDSGRGEELEEKEKVEEEERVRVTEPVVQLPKEHPLPTEFSPGLIHNYEEIYGKSSSSSNKALVSVSPSNDEEYYPIEAEVAAPAVVSDFDMPRAPSFPEERTISEESIQYLEEYYNKQQQQQQYTPIPPLSTAQMQQQGRASMPPSSALPPRNHHTPTATSVTSAFQKVSEELGGEEAEKKLEETIESIILKTRVQMLREATTNLKSSSLIDVVFKDPDNPVRPSVKDLNRLKVAIATELTLNEFAESTKLQDADSAELFRQSNEKLEMLQRNQIMSNPLFSGAYTKTPSLLNVGLTGKDNKQGEVTGEEGEVSSLNSEQQESAHRGNAQCNLHMELLDILNSNGKQHNSITKLSDRINFLNRLVEYKTSSGISWLRLVNLLSGVISKATAIIFGDNGVQQQNNHQSSSVGEGEDNVSALLKAKSTETVSSVNDLDMSSIGIELFFGAASELLEKNLTRVCMDVGRLALYLNIPVVLLKWPKEFTSSDPYKNLLMDSITCFSSKMRVPSLYIIDNIRFDDDDDDDDAEDDQHSASNNIDLFSEKDKRDAVRRVFSKMKSGGASERDLVKEMFVVGNTEVSSVALNGLDTDMSVAYRAGASIIDYKSPVSENFMNSVVNYMEKRKHLINAAVMKLLRKAKLSMEVYCIKYKLKEVSKRCNKTNKSAKKNGGGEIPMRNLMYRTAMQASPPISSLLPPSCMPTFSNKAPKAIAPSYALNTPSFKTMNNNNNSMTLDDTQMSLHTEMYSRKRPSADLINNRIKRIRQWNPSPSSRSSCSP